jgi:hypothetical protein
MLMPSLPPASDADLVYFSTLKMETIMFIRNVGISELHGAEARRTPRGPDIQRGDGAFPNP